MPDLQPRRRSNVPELVYSDDLVTLWCGDGMDWLGGQAPTADAIVTDPPYGDTSLEWDERVDGWPDLLADLDLVPQLWCFGSLRFHLDQREEFRRWRLGQEVIWEKHNGSGFHADRFKRVHEIAVHWYRGEWRSLHHEVPAAHEYGTATKMTVRRKARPTHTGDIGAGHYASEDGGPRLTRSVIRVRSEHGRAVHPTQKPLGILRPLIEYSVPPGGTVLDPFAGSGSTLLAARELGRKAEGCEINPDYCEAAVSRLSQMEMAA